MSLPRTFVLFLVGLASATAQQPPGVPVPPPGVPVAGQEQPQPAGAPAVNPPGGQNQVPLGETLITEPIEELKLSGDALAGLYRKYTGRRVIVSSAASIAEFRFVQDASPADPLTFAVAAELLKKAAILENFVFVPDSQNPNWDILTVATGGTNVKSIGVGVFNEDGPVYSENDTLPDGDEVISYVMTLNYLKPADAQNAFVSIIGQFGAYGSITAIPNASALVITENTTLIRKLIDLKKEIDKPGGVQDTRFIKVRYADVTEIADTLTTLLTAQQSTQTTAGIQRADNAAPPGVPQIPGQAGNSGGGEAIPVQIVPDPRTNRIFAMGRPVDLIFIEGLVREFDVETSEKIFLRRKLRFLAVSDFLDVAEQALTRAFSGTGDGGGGTAGAGGASGGGGGRTQASSRQSSSGRSSAGGNNTSTGGNLGGGSSGGGFGGGGGTGNALDAPENNTVPEARLVGRTLLVADNITNSIVVQGPPSGLEIIERLLDQIDVKPDQVIISTVIGQLTLDDSLDYGVNYLFNNSDIKLGGGGSNGGTFIPGAVAGDGTGGSAATTTVNRFPRFNQSTIAGSGLRALGTIGDLGIYLKSLQSKGNFTVLSRPSIFTANNQKGTISSGERIAIPTSSNSFNNGGASTNIEYQDVVLKLEVIPLVNSDNEITMQIALLNDEQNGTQIIEGAGSNGNNLTVPKISTREILTNVTVPNNETVVLGGLIISRDNKNRSGIPILSSIPYIGGLFGTTIDTKSRSELLVFLQPSVVKSARSLDAVQADFDARYQVSEPLHELADGPGMVPDTADVLPVSDKEGNRYPAVTEPAYSSGNSESSILKPSIRPAFRR
jgi:general secretion pathway protein D